MPLNKLALLRYRIIDKCLQNRYRKWTLNDLIDAVSDALYEYEGIDTGVSKRTVQLDIQNMRSDKLGYHAPIEVVDRKYYQYAEPDYSITNSPLSDQDVDKLSEVVAMLKQFKEFSYFQDLSSLITRLEDKVINRSSPQESVIQFDKNEQLQGTQWLHPLHQAIINKTTVELYYQSFKAQKASVLTTFPYLLKEYNNRWFLLAAVDAPSKIFTFALDRIKGIKENPFIPYQDTNTIDIYTYFDNLIGVSKSPNQPTITVVLKVSAKDLPYYKTKPLHPSQSILNENKEGGLIQLEVIWNFELEREILGRAESIQVVSPARLKRKIRKRLKLAMEAYDKQDK